MKQITSILLSIIFGSCSSSFLDVKPNMQTIVPETLEDYGLLLYENNTFGASSPTQLGLMGTDEYLLSDANYRGLSVVSTDIFQKQAYTWEKEIYTGDESYTDWSKGYARILQANVVLDGLANLEITDENRELFFSIKGTALLHRAFAYYALAQLYCPVYFSETNGTMGLPLRKSADPTLKIDRSSLQDTYHFIENDLREALTLLPPKRKGSFQLEGDKATVHALLVRLYMQMGDYVEAERQAKSCLDIPHELLDYNDFDKNKSYSFPSYGIGNAEILYYNFPTSVRILGEVVIEINPAYLTLYEEGDLRRELFFKSVSGRTVFKGSYIGNSSYFTGLGVDEVYLNYVECLARNGKTETAIHTLNMFREKRISHESYEPYHSMNRDELMVKIMEERKRQLLLRGLRWEDLRRFNKEREYAQDLVRIVEGATFRLEVGSPRWTWPIPPTAIANGGYTQNPR